MNSESAAFPEINPHIVQTFGLSQVLRMACELGHLKYRWASDKDADGVVADGNFNTCFTRAGISGRVIHAWVSLASIRKLLGRFQPFQRIADYASDDLGGRWTAKDVSDVLLQANESGLLDDCVEFSRILAEKHGLRKKPKWILITTLVDYEITRA